jgi:hypothetical protein
MHTASYLPLARHANALQRDVIHPGMFMIQIYEKYTACRASYVRTVDPIGQHETATANPAHLVAEHRGMDKQSINVHQMLYQ